jgi:hypothetical protein
METEVIIARHVICLSVDQSREDSDFLGLKIKAWGPKHHGCIVTGLRYVEVRNRNFGSECGHGVTSLWDFY